MNVHELIEWLQAFEDQEATIYVLSHNDGYYAQHTEKIKFIPELHTKYEDYRDNPFVPPDAPYKHERSLFFGEFLILGERK